MPANPVKTVLLVLGKINLKTKRLGIPVKVVGDNYLPVTDDNRPLGPVNLEAISPDGCGPALVGLRKGADPGQHQKKQKDDLFHAKDFSIF